MGLQRALGMGVVSATWLLLVSHAAPAHAEASQAFTKLGRGVVNIVTGWVEVPKRIHETGEHSGAWAGATWGTLRGLGHGFVRTVAGFYELFTFPFPAPPNYAPVIQPEYVFTDESTSQHETYK